MARSSRGDPRTLSSHQLLLSQSQQSGQQRFSRALYAADYRAADPYSAHHSQYYANSPVSRAEYYVPSDFQDVRGRFIAADRRSSQAVPGHLLSSGGRRADVASTVYPVAPKARGQIYSAYDDDLVVRSHGPPLDAFEYSADGMGVQEAHLSDRRRLGYDVQEFAPRLSNKPIGGGLHPGVSRQGRDAGRYSFSGRQPENFAPNARAPTISEMPLKRSRYSMIVTNEADMYSNYRQAKAQRTRGHDLRVSPHRRPVGQDEREGYRERRRRGNLRERGKRRSPSFRKKRGSESKHLNVNGADDHVDEREQLSKGPSKATRPRQRAGQATAKISREVKQKEDLEDSELGSLYGDLSDSDAENVKKVKDLEEPALEIDDPLDGMIFGCSSSTFHECMRLQLFGLPVRSKELVMRVAPGTKLFLFNFDTKELSGIFEAVSRGGMDIHPDAFVNFGGFPAQVQVGCPEQCPNLPLSEFKPVIKDNYINQHKFRFDLNSSQVKELVKLFRKAASTRPHLHDSTVNDSLGVRTNEISARGSRRRKKPHPEQVASPGGLSAGITPTTNKTVVQGSKRALKRSRKGRRKRKAASGPDSLQANDSTVAKEEVKGGGDTSKREKVDTASVLNMDVAVTEVVESGNSQSLHQHEEIIETLTSNSSVIAGEGSLGPADGPTSMDCTKLPEPLDDLHGRKEVLSLEEMSNSGEFGLACGQAEEQGKSLDSLDKCLDTCDDVVHRSSNSASLSTRLVGLGVSNTVNTLHAHSLVNLDLPGKPSISLSNEVTNLENVLQDKLAGPDVGLYDDDTKDCGLSCPGIDKHQGVLESAVNVSGEFPSDNFENDHLDSASDAVRSVQRGMGDALNMMEPGVEKDLGELTSPEEGTAKLNITDTNASEEEMKMVKNDVNSKLPHGGNEGVLVIIDDTVVGELQSGGKEEDVVVSGEDTVDNELSRAVEDEAVLAAYDDARYNKIHAAGEEEELVMIGEDAVE